MTDAELARARRDAASAVGWTYDRAEGERCGVCARATGRSSRVVSVRLSAEQLGALEQLAERWGCSRNAALARALERAAREK